MCTSKYLCTVTLNFSSNLLKVLRDFCQPNILLVSAIRYWHNTVVRLSVRPFVTLCIVAKRCILKLMFEQVNRKCRNWNTSLQLSTPYTDPQLPRTTPQNDPPEDMHQNKKAPKADFRLKL